MPHDSQRGMHGKTLEGLSHRLRASEERYRLVVKLGRVVNSSLDLRKVFRHAARGIRPLFQCDFLQLLLPNQDDDTAWGFAIDYGTVAKWMEVPSQPLTESAAQLLLESRQTRLVR